MAAIAATNPDVLLFIVFPYLNAHTKNQTGPPALPRSGMNRRCPRAYCKAVAPERALNPGELRGGSHYAACFQPVRRPV
jgi:hypothetical protein